MKKLCFLFLLTIIHGGEPLKIDVRPRIMDHERVNIVVQIDNHSKRSINHLEGFVTVITDKEKQLAEKRLIIIGPNDPALHHDRTVSRNMKMDLHDPFPSYKFNVSKVTFSGDYKIYTYHPKIGFYRID